MSSSWVPMPTPRRSRTVANNGWLDGSASSAHSRGRRPQCSALTNYDPPGAIDQSIQFMVLYTFDLAVLHASDIALDEARALIARAIDKAAQVGVRGGFAVVGGTGVLV